MSFKKSSETRQAARSHAVLDGSVRGQRAARVPDRAVLAVEHEVRESSRSVDGIAAADARAGADTRAVRLPAAPGATAARRLGGRQRALLSRVHRGGIGHATQTAVA